MKVTIKKMTRQNSIQVYLTDQDEDLIRKAARIKRLNISSFARILLIETSMQIISEGGENSQDG